MAELLRMPEVAAGASSAVLSQWPTGAGASFSTGDVIAIIETDKAVVDVEAEADGTLVHLIATEGQEVTIGDPIALMAAPGENVGDIDAALASLGVDSNSNSNAAAAPTSAPVPDSPANDPAPVSTVPAAVPAAVPAVAPGGGTTCKPRHPSVGVVVMVARVTSSPWPLLMPMKFPPADRERKPSRG